MMGKYSSIFITAAVAVTVAVGCGGNSSDSYKPPTFKEVGEVKFSLISNKPINNMGTGILLIDDMIAVEGYQRDSIETFIHIYDTSGRKIADYINMGRGRMKSPFLRCLCIMKARPFISMITMEQEIL